MRTLIFMALAAAAWPALADDVSALREEVKALRQEVQEIKQLLSSLRPPQQQGWERVESGILGLEDAPQRGSAKAPLVLVEFSDYQCPYCGVHAREIFPALDKQYVASGKLRYAVSELPLTQIHPLALQAAEAARCAGDQKRFWDMHAGLFAHQRDAKPWESAARALGIDVAALDACMSVGKYAPLIEHNAEVAQKVGIRATPTFFLGYADGDRVRVVRRLQGAAPLAVFQSEIDALLRQ